MGRGWHPPLSLYVRGLTNCLHIFVGCTPIDPKCDSIKRTSWHLTGKTIAWVGRARWGQGHVNFLYPKNPFLWLLTSSLEIASSVLFILQNMHIVFLFLSLFAILGILLLAILSRKLLTLSTSLVCFLWLTLSISLCQCRLTTTVASGWLKTWIHSTTTSSPCYRIPLTLLFVSCGKT